MGILSATGRANLGIEDYEDFIQRPRAPHKKRDLHIIESFRCYESYVTNRPFSRTCRGGRRGGVGRADNRSV
jgi:hypothetical protein